MISVPGCIQLDDVPEPGDVITYPVPCRLQHRVVRVAQSEGVDFLPSVGGDPDEREFVWCEVDIHGERCAVDESPASRRLIRPATNRSVRAHGAARQMSQ